MDVKALEEYCEAEGSAGTLEGLAAFAKGAMPGPQRPAAGTRKKSGASQASGFCEAKTTERRLVPEEYAHCSPIHWQKVLMERRLAHV